MPPTAASPENSKWGCQGVGLLSFLSAQAERLGLVLFKMFSECSEKSIVGVVCHSETLQGP